MTYVNVCDATQLAIETYQWRDFDLTLDLKAPLAGRSFRMEVRDMAGLLVLSFAPANGLTTDGTMIGLHKLGGSMGVPCGYHEYDLMETTGGMRVTRLRGSFLVKPSVTRS